MSHQGPRARAGFLAAATLALGSCASLSTTQKTETSGTYESTGFAVTFFSIDIPRRAVDIARDNASDSRLTNMQVSKVTVWPYFGWFDWLLDILGPRWARVEGTWGFTGSEPGAAGATSGSSPGS